MTRSTSCGTTASDSVWPPPILSASASSYEMLSCFWISSVNALPPIVTSRVNIVVPRARMLMLVTAAPTLTSTTVSSVGG